MASPRPVSGAIRANPTFPFGKYAGQEVSDVASDDPGYIAWVLTTNIPERYPALAPALEALSKLDTVRAAVAEREVRPPREPKSKKGRRSGAPVAPAYVHDDDNEGPEPYASLSTGGYLPEVKLEGGYTEHAKQLRTVLKRAFPGVTFRVAQSHGGGSSYSVKWTDGPSEKMVRRVTRLFVGKSFDGMQDLESSVPALAFGDDGRPVGRVRYGIGYIFEGREYSRAFVEGAIARKGARLDNLTLSARDSSFGARIEITRTDGTRADYNDERSADRHIELRELSAGYYGTNTQKRAAEAQAAAREGRPDPALAAKQRASADRLEAAAQPKLHSATAEQRPTRRRAMIAAAMEAEGERMMHAARALRALADATEAGTAPPEVAGVSTQLAAQQLSGNAVWGAGTPAGTDPRHGRERLMEVWNTLAESADTDAAARAAERAAKAAERELIGSKIPDFFPTPPALADRMVAEAGILDDAERVLEPSAGKGDLVDAVRRAAPSATVEACEVSPRLRDVLAARGVALVGADFLDYHPGPVYDAVVMNPPFENGADAAHIRHAFGCLVPGGRLVAVAGEGLFFRADRAGFREWLASVGGSAEKLPEGSFASAFRSTGVAARLVVIEAPDAYVPPSAPATTDADADDAALVAEALPMLAAALRRKIEAGADRQKAAAVVEALVSLCVAAGLAEDQTADVYALETLLARTPEPAPRPRAARATKPRAAAPATPPRGPPPAPAPAPATRRDLVAGAVGDETRVVFSPDGKLFETARYAAIELEDLVASHHPDCSANAAHGIASAQPRDRSAKELCRQADTIARDLDPALMASLAPDAFSGPPTTNARGEVIQGNGRAISLRVAYERYPEKAARYRAYLMEHPARWGLPAPRVWTMRQPVLVRVTLADDSRARVLGNALNTFEAEQSPLDRAKALVRSMSPAALAGLGVGFDALMERAGDGATLRAVLDDPSAVELVGLLPGLDRGGLLAGGRLTPKGKDLLGDLLIAVLFDDGQPGTNARYEAIPHAARMGIERAMGALVPHAASAGPRLRRAAELVRRVAGNPASSRSADVLRQVDPFDTATFEIGDDVLADLWLTARTQKEVADVLRAYARFLSGYETLFESAPPMTEPDAFRAAVVERRRPNPAGSVADGVAVAVLGLVDRLDTTRASYTDDDSGTLLVWVPALSRILCVPKERARAAGRAAHGDEARTDALAAYGEWLNDEPDGRALALDLPPAALAARLPRAAQVGTGQQIRYRSDKRMERGDRAGRLNGYYHDFQRGRRAVHLIPYPDGGPPVLTVSGVVIDRRGILN